MADEFTVLSYDALTGQQLDTIPVGALSFSSQLNQPKSLSGTFNSTDPDIRKLDIWGSTKPARTVICVDYRSALVWGGLTVAPRTFTLSQKEKVPLQANELWSYFTRRVLATDYSSPPYSGIDPPPGTMPIWNAASVGSPANLWDPMLMAGQIVSDAMNYSNTGGINYGTLLGGIPILYNGYSSVSSYLASGSQTSSANYVNFTAPFTSLQTVDSIVTEIVNLGLGVGPDFGIDIAYSSVPGSPPAAALNFSTPTRGRPYSETNLVIDTANVYDYTVTEDGNQAAWQVYERGGAGAINVGINTNAQEAGYPLLEQVNDHSFITSGTVQNILTQISISDLFICSYPPVSFSIVMKVNDPGCPFGSYITGDHVWLTVQPDERFPAGLQGEWRIIGWTVNAPDAGAAKVTLTLNVPPAVTATGPSV